MTGTVWMRSEFPWPQSAYVISVDDRWVPSFRQALQDLGFETIEIEGSRQHDFESFWTEIHRAFRVPDWCGTNWDSIDDVAWDEFYDVPRIAILWRDAAEAATAHLRLYSEAIAWMKDSVRRPDTQIELILTGTGPAFCRPFSLACTLA